VKNLVLHPYRGGGHIWDILHAYMFSMQDCITKNCFLLAGDGKVEYTAIPKVAV